MASVLKHIFPKALSMSLALIFLFFSIGFGQDIQAQADSRKKTEEAILKEILEKTREYCQKLLDSSLYFICIEEIKERIDYSRDELPRNYEKRSLDPIAGAVKSTKAIITSIKTNRLVYDYQLIRKNGVIEERRILLEENGKKKNEKEAPLKTELFEHRYVIAGPVGLLSGYWQQRHDYRIIKEEDIEGEKTVVVEAIPKTPSEVRHLSGKIWVREKDFNIL